MFLLGTGRQRAAKTSRVLVNLTPLTFASWEAAMKGEDYVTTNFESYNVADNQSYDEGIIGPIGCDLRFGGDFDAGTCPTQNPPGLFPRDDLANLQFLTSRIDAVGWTFTYARLRSAVNSGDIKGKVLFNCGGMSQGRFFYPNASVNVN